MENIPKFKKHCIPISLKLTQVPRIPFNIYKNILYPFKFLANIPVSRKPFQALRDAAVFTSMRLLNVFLCSVFHTSIKFVSAHKC